MSESQVIPAPGTEVPTKFEPASARLSAPPILITEQEVALGTTAAQGPQPRTSRRWITATRLIAVGIRRMFPTSTANSRSTPRYYPRHYGFIEDALMAREMHRLSTATEY